MRGTVTLGGSSPRATFRVQAGAEKFDNYKAGSFDSRGYAAALRERARSSRPTPSTPTSASTLARSRIRSTSLSCSTDAEILNSQAEGKFVNASGLFKLGDRRTLRVRYQSRRMEDVGFPDFEQPFFFNDTSLPHSNLDKLSARYEARALTPWLANLSLTALLPAHRTAVADDAARAVPGADGGRRSFRFRCSGSTSSPTPSSAYGRLGVDLNAVFVPAREPPAHHRPELLPRSQQRPADDDDADVAVGAGRARRAWTGAASCSRRRWRSARRRLRIRSAFPMRASATLRCSRRTNGACGRRCRLSPAFAAISTPS